MSKHTSNKTNSASQKNVTLSASASGGGSVRPARPDATASGNEGQTLISCPFQIVNYGWDTFHVTWKIINENKTLLARLADEKKKIQSGVESSGLFRFMDDDNNKFVWNLQRSGSKLYPYILRSGDITLCLSTRRCGSTIPNASLMIGSLTCHSDLAAFLRGLKYWLKLVGISIFEEKVSRCDIHADIIHDIKQGRIDKVNQYITFARDDTIHHSHRKFTGITWGSGQIMCRIYDKQLEMAQTQNIEKIIFFNNLWQTDTKTPVTRVEFQLRRQAIKQFFDGSGLESIVGSPAPEKDVAETDVAALLARAGDLWEYLTCHWLRHCSKFVNRESNNQSRDAETSHFWKCIQGAFEKKVEPLERNRGQKHINIPALRAQAIGILTTIAAGLGHLGQNFFELIPTLTDIVSQDLIKVMSAIDFSDKFAAKQSRAVICF